MPIPTQEPFQESYVNSFGYFNYGGSVAIFNDDFLFRDPADGNVKPMAYLSTANYANYSSQWLLQRAAKKYFAGLAGFAKLSTDPAEKAKLVKTDLCIITNLASATCNAGDMVAVALNGSNNACLSDTVVVTLDPAKAIGRVVSDELYSAAGTKVKVRLFSNLVNRPESNEIGQLTETINFGSIAGTSTTGTYTFTQKLPAGALVIGVRFQVATILAAPSLSAASLNFGWTGHTSAFSAQAGDAFTAAGYFSSLATAAGPQVSAETAPLATFGLTGANANALTAGQVIATIFYQPPALP